nr:clavata3/endosperm 25 [Panax ginseng]
MVGSGRVSGGSVGVVLLVGVLFFLFIGIISCQTRQMATITVPSTGSFELLKPIEKQRRAGHRHFDLNYVSKRRVPNGPDPIHNRRAGKSTQPPDRA